MHRSRLFRLLLAGWPGLLSLLLASPTRAGEAYTFRRELRLAPGEYYAVRYDPSRREFVGEEPGRRYGALDARARDQVLRAPRWLREALADRLVELALDVIDVGDDASPIMHDVDGDGHADLVAGNREGRLACFMGPRFEEDAKRFDHVRVSGNASPFFFDIDRDGKAELLVADDAGTLHVWTGPAWLKAGPSVALPLSARVRFAVNEGGDLSVLGPKEGAWRLEAGKKAFSPVELSPGLGTPGRLSFKGGSLFVRDSGHGNLSVRAEGAVPDGLLENLGRIGTGSPVFHDLDGDGAPELLLGHADGTIRVFPNRGRAGEPWFSVFSAEVRRKFDVDVGYLSSPRVADLDGDSHADVISGAKEGALHFFPGPGFRENDALLASLSFEGPVVPAPGDFNGDGKTDLAVGMADGRVLLFLGPGFSKGEKPATTVVSYASPYAFDFDGDGKTDLLVGGGDGTIRFFRNVDGSFEEVPDRFKGLQAGEYPSPAVWDANGDGSPDLVVGDRGGKIRVFLAPDWTEAKKGLGLDGATGFAVPAFGDLTGDGLPELVLGSLDGGITYFEREGEIWVEKGSWKFEGARGLSKAEDYFLRVHRHAEPLRGAVDKKSLVAFVELLASAEDRFFDEVAFVLAHTPAEILRAMGRVGNADLLLENARLIYETASKVRYAELVEKEDFTTLSYVLEEGKRVELPREVYYWWVVHPRLYAEVPLRVDASYWERDFEHYGITHEAWTRREVGIIELGAGPKCRFWRRYLTEDRKYGKTLLEVVEPAGTLKEAVYLAGDWISQSMPDSWFTYGLKSTDLQPNVIYQKNYGSCGEASILGAACSRTLLIASACTGCGGEDHIWNEYWYDGAWFAWDVCKPSHQIRYPWSCCERAEHTGTQVLTVTRWRGNGLVEARTAKVAQPPGSGSTESGKGYTETGTLTVRVVDRDGVPVEGAALVIRSNVRNYWRNSIWGYTDPEGECRFTLGRPHKKCMLDVITQQGLTGVTHIPIEEKGTFEVRLRVSGRFGGRRRAWAGLPPVEEAGPAENRLRAGIEVLEEVQRPPNLATARRPREKTTDFMKKTGYTGTRWVPQANGSRCGIAVGRLSAQAFERFLRTRSLDGAMRVTKGAIDVPFHPGAGDVLVFMNPNRFTHVRFKASLTASLASSLPRIVLTKAPDRAKTGERVLFRGRASDNLHVACLEFSSDGGATWSGATESYDRAGGTFAYEWDTGRGGPLLPGKHRVAFRVKDGAGATAQTDTLDFILEPAREFRRQVIRQDDPESPLPRSSWVLGPFRVSEKERFLGIHSENPDREFDMDLFLFRDKNGNRKLDGMEEVLAKSTTPTALEKIVVGRPPGGVYWIYCQGWSVKAPEERGDGENEGDAHGPARFLGLHDENPDGKSASARLDLFLSFDVQPVLFTDVAPVRTVPADEIAVRASFVPGARVDPSSVRILVDGEDLTDRAKITGEGISLALDPAEPGREFAVAVEAKSASGIEDRASWTFKAVALPVRVSAMPTEDETGLVVEATARKGRGLVKARARFTRKGKDAWSAWVELEAGSEGIRKGRLVLDDCPKGAYVAEVEFEIEAEGPGSVKTAFKLKRGTVQPKRLFVFPANGAKVYDPRPSLSVHVTGEDRDRVGSIRLFLDGEEITARCRMYGPSARCFPEADLAPGEHTLKAVVKLKDGSERERTSVFTVTRMGETGKKD